MYCPQCGTKAIDGADFCQNCGAKLIDDKAAHSSEEASARQAQPDDGRSNSSEKKKFKKWPVLLCATVVAVAVILVLCFWEGKIDYVATVKAYQPFANSQGLPYTCEEVFERYIESPQWEVYESNKANYVTASGIAKGSDADIALTIQVTPNSEDASYVVFDIKSAIFDGKSFPDPVNFLYALFVVYDEDYTDLSNFSDILNPLNSAIDNGPNESAPSTDSSNAGSDPTAAKQTIPAWCSGKYYGGDLYSTITFPASHQDPFEISFYRVTSMDDCSITVKTENQIEFTGCDGAVRGTLESHGGSSILLTITASDGNVLPAGTVMEFYYDYRDENYTSTSDSYDFCGIYALPDIPQNRIQIWPLYENVYISMMKGSDTIAVAEVPDWNIEYVNDAAHFTGYILGNEEEISGYYDPLSETLELWSESDDGRSALAYHSLGGTYFKQYLD